MMPLRDDQYISLSPTDSPAEDAEMDTVDGQQVGKGLTQLPGDTPRTPGRCKIRLAVDSEIGKSSSSVFSL